MPIGNPVTLTSNVASKTISDTATASQTLFNVTGGYRINSLGVFKNGSRLQDGVDYTARDGLTVTLLSAASGGDKLQFVVFDTFRVAEAIRPAVDEQTIRGNLNVVGILSCTDLEGPVSLNITSGIQTFHDVRVGGALTVAGTLTYEDVGNTNTTGIATFSGGMKILGVGATVTTLNVTGVSTFTGAINGNLTGNATGLSGAPNIDCGTGSFTGDVDIADKIVHTGDTNTAIRFPATDTITVETAGSERVRVTSGGGFAIGTILSGNSANKLTVRQDNVNNIVDALLLNNGSTNNQADTGVRINFSGSSEASSNIRYAYIESATATTGNDHYIAFGTNAASTTPTERLRIDSSGRLLVGTTTEGAANADNLTIADSGHAGITIRSGTSSKGAVFFSDATSGSGEYEGVIEYNHDDNDMLFFTGGTERLRITSAGNVSIQNDSGKFTAGASDDLQIYHDGSNSYIKDAGSGDLIVQANNLRLSNTSGTNYLYGTSSAEVSLYHNGSVKLATSATGVTVTGTLNATTAITQNGKGLASTGKAIAMAMVFG